VREIIQKKPNLFEFDADTHQYFVDGVQFSSVTEILRATGITPAIPFASDMDRWYGSAIHKAVELYVKKELGWEDVDPRLMPAVEGFMDFEKLTGFKVTDSERKLYSSIGNVAGTVDLTGVFPDGKVGVVDLKSGAVNGAVAIQTAGYAWLLSPWETFHNRPNFKRFGLSLQNGKPKLREFTEGSDYNVWMSAVSVYNWQRNNGRK
jgi:hypothetical protein